MLLFWPLLLRGLAFVASAGRGVAAGARAVGAGSAAAGGRSALGSLGASIGRFVAPAVAAVGRTGIAGSVSRFGGLAASTARFVAARPLTAANLASRLFNRNNGSNQPVSPQTVSQAARNYGTPNPTAQQVATFAQQQRAQQMANTGLSAFARQAASTTASLAKFSAGASAATVAIRYLNNQFLQTAEARRQFSSPINSALAQLERNSLRREVKTASGTSATTAARIAEIDRLAEARQPLTIATGNFSNLIGTAGTRIQAGVYEIANSLGVPALLESLNRGLAKWLGVDLTNQSEGAIQGELKSILRNALTGEYVPRSPGGPGA